LLPGDGLRPSVDRTGGQKKRGRALA